MLSKKQKIFFNWFAVVLWLGVIYYFSNQPNLKSEFKPLWDLVFRKIAHMAEYFVLAALFFRALREHGLSFIKTLIVVILLTILSSGLDEWHQTFITGRQGKFFDTLIDNIGALAFIFLKLIYRRHEKDLPY
jgi:VanZ family protein